MVESLMQSSSQINSTPARSDWYMSAMEHLVGVVQEVSAARNLDAVMEIVRKAARELTGADGATFVLRDDDKCFYAEENAISPLWKGQRFPMKICISGWVMLNGQPVVIPDIYEDPRIPVDAYRPTFVKSLAMVPIRQTNPVGAIGNYWATKRQPTDEEIAVLQALAHVTSVAMENVALYDRLEEKVRALEKSNEDLSRFAWIASHDLKSPLRGIDNLSKWISEDLGGKLEGKSKEHMDTLRKRVQRMDKLLTDILKYAQIEHKLAPEHVEIITGRDLVEDIQMLNDIPPALTLRVAHGFENIQVPRLPLQQIFCNLVANAVKHHDKAQGTVEIGFEEQPYNYTFFVKDDGPGIDPEYHSRIFEMFQTLRPRDTMEGSGMGLAIVKKILNLYGQDISVSSQPGQGATFQFTWPKNAS